MCFKIRISAAMTSNYISISIALQAASFEHDPDAGGADGCDGCDPGLTSCKAPLIACSDLSIPSVRCQGSQGTFS